MRRTIIAAIGAVLLLGACHDGPGDPDENDVGHRLRLVKVCADGSQLLKDSLVAGAPFYRWKFHEWGPNELTRLDAEVQPDSVCR